MEAKHILIVDDTPENLQVLGDMLELEGHEVLIATNGRQALDIAMGTPSPDLILLDIMMPGMDGYEVCRRLKADPALGKIPVIFISALGTTEQKVQAFREGGVDYITKPFQTEEVVARVRTHLSLTQLKQLEDEIAVRKQAEQEMRKLTEAVRQTSEAIVVTLPDGRITYVNPAFEQLTGYRFDEVIGQTPRILKSEQQDDTLYRNLWDTLLAGNRWAGRLIEQRKDGIPYTAEYSISPVKNQEGHISNFVWIMRDITKELDLEKRMAQAQKMEAIGSLAGGIAHDFNNILYPIIGFSDMLLQDLPADDRGHNYAQEINAAAQRASGLVNQILAFSRQSKPQKLPIRIQPILRDVLKLTRVTIPANINIKSHIQKDCREVVADPTQVHQILMNLITNAYHAVEENNGTITVELKERVHEIESPAIPLLEPGSYACMTITDTGMGIDPAIIGKIFEPYFTTKEQGKGTGLGLSIVHGIVKEHGGDIRVVSRKGEGATFEVCLPIAAITDGAATAKALSTYPRGTEKILLVDDEKPIVDLLKLILERLGYQVTACTSSIETLAVFQADPLQFDLVITDMAMPGMTGLMLAEKLIAVRADMPILLYTGYSEKIDREGAIAKGIKGVLMKPVVTSDLAEMLRKLLDKRP